MDTYNLNSKSKNNFDELVNALTSEDPAKQRQAKRQLIAYGKCAVPHMMILLDHPQVEVRCNAIKILGYIRDPSTIPGLLNLLEDEAFEVRWQAAKSLIKMKGDCVIPLLKELQKPDRFGSPRFLEGSHHILRVLHRKGYLGPSTQVLEAFKAPEKEITIPWAAEKTLEILNIAQSQENEQ
jgi:hypothetical protein